MTEYLPGVSAAVSEVTVHNPLLRTLDTSVELDELCVLLTLAKYYGASNVLEVGTWDGNTTLNLAANIPDDAKVVTVDLPLDNSGEDGALLRPGERLNVTPRQRVGEQYMDSPFRHKIKQVLGDSATLNWQELGGPFDFMFLDGCHTSAYVHSDTKNALSCISPGGLIIWHDVDGAGAGAVVSAYAAAGIQVVWLAGTRLALWQVEEPDQAQQILQDISF